MLAKTAHPETEQNAEPRIGVWHLNGEKLLWTGRPRPKSANPTLRGVLSFLLFLVYMFVAGTVAGVALFTRDPGREGTGTVSNLALGLIAAGVAAFMLFGFYGGILRHIVDNYGRSKTFYGLSDQRAIIETSRSVRFVPLESITSVEVECDGRGMGTVSCRSDVVEGLDFFATTPAFVFWPITPEFVREGPFDDPLFRHVLDSEHVLTLLRTARQARIADVKHPREKRRTL